MIAISKLWFYMIRIAIAIHGGIKTVSGEVKFQNVDVFVYLAMPFVIHSEYERCALLLATWFYLCVTLCVNYTNPN